MCRLHDSVKNSQVIYKILDPVLLPLSVHGGWFLDAPQTPKSADAQVSYMK